MRVSFDYNRSRQSLLIFVGEIRDVKLPAGTETLFCQILCYRPQTFQSTVYMVTHKDFILGTH